MSAGILALKIGLVSGIVGVSIATPILATNKGSLVTEPGQGSQITDSQLREAGREDSRDSASPQTEVSSERGGSPSAISDLSHLGSSVSSHVPAIKKEEFDKKCFIVPAEIKGKDSNVQLLTCYEEKKIRADAIEKQLEYESIFHIYSKNKQANPVEIKGSLYWNPLSQQLIAKLENSSDMEYNFTATGGKWGGISESKSVNLLDKRECAIYEATLNDSTPQETHLLVCGGDSVDYELDNPKGIPLVEWKLEN